MIKNFILTPNSFKKTEVQPTHFIMYKPGDGQKYIKIGAGWKKTNEDGSWFVSIKLNDPTDKYPGAYLEIEDALTSDPSIKEEIQQAQKDNQEAVNDFNEINPESIPF